jgi:hypothetical protein
VTANLAFIAVGETTSIGRVTVDLGSLIPGYGSRILCS